jgi:CelD/BcsL family acetyltransferase involved in cellulose biosynthesis
LSLNTSGEPSTDTAYSEYNDLICLEGFEQEVACELAHYMLSQATDEIVLTNFTDSAGYSSLKSALVTYRIEEHVDSSYFIDLSKVRDASLPYIATLGRKVRKHVRQNIRSYSGRGELVVERAADIAGASAMLEELAVLSQQRWASLGRRSSFSSSLFRTFSNNLVRRCVPKTSENEGNVHLLRISAAGQTIGIVFTLIYRGKVYFYQCGYHYTGDERLSPGTVTLAQVVQYYLDAGYMEFDMLSGEGKYKQMLSNDHRPIFKAVFRRAGVKASAISYLRRINGTLTSWRND